uniref:Mitochondrial import inner membrane translocase subunit TIM16 n=1 Tax=Bionectria ochroleuca TaxID=29856 RepID=A0A8H7NFX6_BIOOC
MAHKFVITAFLTGSRILGRSFVAAYRQAQASTAYQRAQAKNGNAAGGRALAGSMTLDEACRILNVKPPPAARPTWRRSSSATSASSTPTSRRRAAASTSRARSSVPKNGSRPSWVL